MIGQTISHYRILEKLGEGGMGVVYEAEDLKLHRSVALKFLPHESFSSKDTRTRFLREARTAASLDHASVCPIFEIIETEDHSFIAMALVKGRTLEEMIAERPLELGVALDIAIQVAEGLDHAHQKSIVHRDIKPSNVVVSTDGRAKILDFGLARSVGDTQLTMEGTVLGTVAYMSPEQARAEEVDHRSDIWSLGVVLYEMMSGQRPFAGDHQQAVIYSILNENPESLTGLRAGITLELERLIDRCLEKDPGSRYQTAGDLTSDLRRLRQRLESSTRSSVTASRRVRSRRRWPWLAGVAVALIAVLVLAIYPRLVGRSGPASESGRQKLVVLPFENLGAPEDEYFAAGITEEITSRLALIKGLGVISRTSAWHYKGSGKTIQEIGDELKVGYVLEGTVRWEKTAIGGSRVRVTPRLVRVADDNQLWAEMYDDDFEAIFDVQSRIAGQVASKLNLVLTRGEQQRLDARPTDNVVAYQFYLRGIDHIVFPHLPEENYRQAQQLLEQAIAIDPDFALAYARLSDAHLGLYFFGYDHTSERLALVKQAVDQALELDPGLPEAQRQLGYYYYQGLLDYDKALEQFSNLARVLPNDAQLLQDISFIWRRQGRMREALANQLSAFEMSPTDASFCAEIANTYGGLRMYEEALAYCDQATAMAPDNHWGYLLKSLILFNRSGDAAAAKAVLVSCPSARASVDIYVQYYFDMLAGDYQSALALLDNLDEDVIRMQSGYVPVNMLRGQVLDGLGDRGRAVAAFESALALLEGALRDNPQDARIHSSLGITYAGLGRTQEAIAAGRRAVKIYPVSRDAILGMDRLVNLAQIYAMVGENGQALDTTRNILSLPGIYTVYHFELHPSFDAMRREPGYQAIREEFGRHSS